MKTLVHIITFLLIAGCSGHKEDEPIGSATMKKNGTLCLHLRAETDEMIGDAYFEIEKSDPKYASWLAHVSPISPGESKLVKPRKTNTQPESPLDGLSAAQ